jgi:hypothetical protein
MKMGRVILAATVAALFVGLLASGGCGSSGSGSTSSVASPRLEVLGAASNHILWTFDGNTTLYVVEENVPLTLAGSGLPPDKTIDIRLGITYPEDVDVGNLTTNASGAFYEVAPDAGLDTSWRCEPPLCPEARTFIWRAFPVKAVLNGEVLATYPMVAHEP